MSLTADDLNNFLCPFFSCLVIAGVYLLWKAGRIPVKEKEAADAIRSFLPEICPGAAVSINSATFVHGRLNCRLKWRHFVAAKSKSNDRSTVLSFHIPDWMAQVLEGKDFTVDHGLPSQYAGLPEADVPQEYTDFVQGRLNGRVPGVPFVNAKSVDKALQEALQHDLATYKIVNAADMSSLWVRNSYALKGTLFSAELPGFIWSEETFQTLVKRTMAMLKRAYLVACRLKGVQPVERAVMNAFLGAHGWSLGDEDSDVAIVDEIEREMAEENAAPGRLLDSPDAAADAIADEIGRDLAKEDVGNGGDEGETLAIGDGER